MKAVQYVGDHTVEVVDLPTPEPGPADVLLEPLAVGVCGTDQHIIEGDYTSRPPITLGHEVCARVLEVGAATRSLRPGDLVTVEPHIYCGVCVHCQSGRPHLCPERQAPGVHLPGGMAERMVVPETLAYRLDPDTPPLLGALVEPLACAVHGIDRLAPVSGSSAAVFGVGPAGALLISLLRRAGMSTVVAVETRQQRRDLALRMGADVALDPTDAGFADTMAELTRGDGFRYVVDAVGSSKVLAQATAVASRGATILVFGVARPGDRWEVSPNEIYAKELSVLGTALNPFTHRRAAELVNSLGLDQLRVGTFGLDEVHDALAAQADGRVDKVLVLPNGSSW